MINIIFRHIVDFFKSLFSNTSDTDPKYVVGIFCTALWGWMVVYHTYSKFNIQSELIWANIGLIAACFGLDVVRAVKAMNVKGGSESTKIESDTNNEVTKKEVKENKPE